MFWGVLQLYDEWQHQENALLIDEYSTSRSTAMPVGYNTGWTALFIWLVCFGTKSKTGMGKSNSKIETDLSDIICYEIRKQWLANSGLKKKKLTWEKRHRLQPSHRNTHLNLPVCKEQDLWPPILKHGKVWRVDAELVYSALVHTTVRLSVCEFMLFIFH